MSVIRVLSVAALLLALAVDAQAQRYRRGMMYPSPYRGVVVSPYGVSVRTPYYSYGYGVAPRPATPSGYTTRYAWPGGSLRVEAGVSAPTPAASPSGPTPADYLEEAPSFDPSAPAVSEDMVGELSNAIAALDAKFNEFNGGEGWQRYLTPADAAPADPAYRAKLLQRMNSISRDQQFASVSSLAEFRRVHELLERIATTPPAPPTRPALPSAPVEAQPDLDGAEAIPAPQVKTTSAISPVDEGGEHSVLAN